MKVIFAFLIACAFCMPADLLEFQEDSETKPMAFIKGFLEGLGEKGNLEEIKKCVEGADKIIDDIIEAIKLIATKKFENIIQGVMKLVGAVNQLLAMLQPCMASFKELQKLFEKLKHIDIGKIAMKILGHLTELIAYIMSAIEAFKRQDFGPAGKNIGCFLRIVFLDDSITDFTAPEFSFEDVIKILQGFLSEINQTGMLSSTIECVEHMPEIYKEFLDLIEMLKKIKWENIEELADVMVKVLDMVKGILNSILPCSRSPAEVIAMIKKIGSITAEKLLEHVLKHIGSLLADITSIIGHIKEAKFFEVGKDLGDIFYVLLLADEQEV